MLNISSKQVILGFLSVLFVFQASGQKILTIKEAEQTALANYGTIKAKANQLNASKANLTESKTENLPDLTLSGQQDYGTVNSQYGPLYAFKGQALSSAGPTLGSQNWNAAFGSLYISTINWDFFSFGKAKEKVKVQKNVVNLNETDLVQEQFQHEIRVASTYLNLLAAQQLSKAGQDNLNRAIDLQKVVIARVKNGLNPGVDSSQANAEVANAKIVLTNAQETEQEQSNLLAQYLGVLPQNFTLDSTFISKAPINADVQTQLNLANHPTLRYYQNLINVSDEEVKYLRTFNYPTFSLVGVFDARGTGFNQGYGANQSLYTSSYGTGVDPTRYNYLFGIGVTWNITTPLRVHYQVKAQKFTSAQYQNTYDLYNEQLRDQEVLAETRISNALKNYREVPEEVKAATDAYHQKFALYQNGLSNIVDFTQALYVLNRAEVDNYIASNNVWQALLYKAAATGDFGIFMNNF
ncbi:outer membrane protein TolC [Mucilaginibacter frigoritolerans]|uniref:Outer membrane protein TolC n=1 Tax=Mucilaginibacter frigoritolerans TaxID=652788 RepID=A0A562TQU1_9SPHI|nr:TolC family protein [Mucilaginibacter frigoritolerans]TWI95892.1 outer membrane protein TolC [Mucilaginibacter frigoritolerans]